MLDDLRFPSGVTFAQAKKDAKRLANSQSIPHTEALDKIAAQHGLALPWAKVPAALHELNAEIASLPFPVMASLPFPVAGQELLSVSFTGLRNEAVVVGHVGSGKLVSLIRSATRQAQEHVRPTVLCSAFDQRKTLDLEPSVWQDGASTDTGIITGFHPGVPGYPDIRALNLPAGTVILLDEGVPREARPYWHECQAWARANRIALVYLLQEAGPLSDLLKSVNTAFVLSPLPGKGHQFSLRQADGQQSLVDFAPWLTSLDCFREVIPRVVRADPKVNTFYLHPNSTSDAEAATMKAVLGLRSEGKNATVGGRFKGM